MVIWTLVIFFILIFIGIPIAFSFGLAGVFHWLLTEPENLIVVATRSFGSIDSFSLMAIPLFLLAGDIMREGAISQYLIYMVNLIVGRIKASLAHVTVLASMFFGAISGSSAATVAAIGGIMIPEMIRKGYSREYAVAIAAVSGFLGILIPPSIPMIVYGINAEVSISKLFLGGVTPGILCGIGFMIVSRILYSRDIESFGGGTHHLSEIDSLSNQEKLRNAIKAIPALIMPVIILGGIYSGIFTPTEAGAVAALYGIVVAMAFYRSLNTKSLVFTSGKSALMSAVILLIISLASVFGWIITVEQVPAKVTEYITGITTNKYIILLMLNIFYLFLGTFMETIIAIVITTPIFLPLIKAVGVDPVHFGVIMVTNLCIGLITPPMSLNLLLASKIGHVSILQTIRPLMPYFLVSLVVLQIVTYVPEIVLFLPNLLS